MLLLPLLNCVSSYIYCKLKHSGDAPILVFHTYPNRVKESLMKAVLVFCKAKLYYPAVVVSCLQSTCTISPHTMPITDSVTDHARCGLANKLWTTKT